MGVVLLLSVVGGVNTQRASNGLAPLDVSSRLSSYAQAHAEKMAAEGAIFHSSSAYLQKAAGSGWERIGETVGRGGSADSVVKAFFDSPSHRATLLGDFTHIGVGVAIAEGVTYVSLIVVKYVTTSPPTTSPPTTTPTTSPPTTAPRPKVTTTTAPTTTTTTLPPVPPPVIHVCDESLVPEPCLI
jgi:hypothetical protein